MATARARWEELNSRRDMVLERARQAAALTIPSIMPPDGSDENTVLPTPFQSLGARGVNNLASKLLLTLFPAGQPFFRFQIADDVLESLGAGANEVEELLRRLENRLMARLERGNHRVQLFAALRHLIVTGNALLFVPKRGDVRMFGLRSFCVVRDPEGHVVETVIREKVHPKTLAPEIRAACDVDVSTSAPKRDEPIDVYTWVRLLEDSERVEWFQEINEKRVPDSEGRTKVEENPYIVLRWSAAPDEDYGRGHVEEYLGDLRSLEGLTKAVFQFASAASKIVFLVRPNSVTDIDDLVDAESGDFVTGKEEDISPIQIEKYADFRVAKAVIDELTLRLSHAFLLHSGTVRDAERVTAEEIRAMAQELEDVLGGVFTVQSQEFQLPLVRRMMAQMKAAGEFPKFPTVAGRPAVEPAIVTGFDALGRGHELNRLRAYLADVQAVIGPGAIQLFNEVQLAKRMATAHNVDVEELLKSEDQLAQERQQAALSAAGAAAAPGVAQEVAKGLVQQRTGGD